MATAQTSAIQSDPSTKSLAYARMEMSWPMLDALCSGTDGMREQGEVWLPRRMREPKNFYNARLKSSFLYGALSDTLDGIVAKPFSKDVTIKGTLPEPLLSMVDDVDGAGTTLTEFAASLFYCGWKYGVAHVVVDFPRRPEIEQEIIAREEGESIPDVTPTNSMAADAARNARPTFSLVSPKDMLGWRTEKDGGSTVIKQIRFRETTVEPVGDYGEAEVERIRVLEPGVWRLFERAAQTASAGMQWNEISGIMTPISVVPVTTFYIKRVGFMEAMPPLLDLAHLNVAHWQSSSLQRNSLDVARIPILVRLGFPSDDADGEASGTVVSSNVSFESPNTDAKAFYCEHSGAALAAGDVDLKSLREQMEVLGLQPWMQKGDTATGVASNDEKSECAVQRSVRSLELALRRAFELAAEWVGVTLSEDFEVSVFDDFGIAPERAQDVQFLIQMRQQKLITHKTFLTEVKKRAVLGGDVDVDSEVSATKEEGDSLGMMFGGAPFGGGRPFGGGTTEDENDEDENDEPPSNRRAPSPRGVPFG
jgi:hypothetical protein